MENKGRRYPGKKIALLGILAGLGLVAFLLESLIPIPYLPGAKLGFANIFSLLALLLYGLPEALFVVIARTVLGSLFAGNVSMLLYSLTAGVVSTCISPSAAVRTAAREFSVHQRCRRDRTQSGPAARLLCTDGHDAPVRLLPLSVPDGRRRGRCDRARRHIYFESIPRADVCNVCAAIPSQGG